MEALYFFACVAALAIQIWLISLFVGMSSNIRKIKEAVTGEYSLNRDNSLSEDEVKLALILHKESQIYERLVSRLYSTLNKSDLTNDPEIAFCDKKIGVAKEFCSMLGLELPEQLSSVEAFTKFKKN